MQRKDTFLENHCELVSLQFRAGSSIIDSAHTLAITARIKAKYLVTRQIAHKKCIHAHPVQCANIATEQCCTLVR
jgi:hypothetical protein